MLFRVMDQMLTPHTSEALKTVAKFEDGDIVEVSILNPMHTKFNAKIFAAIAALAKATGVTTEAMQARLLVMTGRFEMVAVTPHKKVMVAHSMSRASMTEKERQDFWDDMRDVANTHILPLLDDPTADNIRVMFDEQPHQTETV
jgi:hypothetical protein